MIERSCIRCHQPVLLEDGHLSYCAHCGAPQIFLSEELQAEIAENARAYNDRLSPETPVAPAAEPPPPPSRRQALLRPRAASAAHGPWPLAVHYALLSAAIALALGLLSLLLPAVSVLMLLWVVSAPVLTVAFFNARSQAATPPGSAFSARLGLLTGVLLTLCCALVFTASLDLSRFVIHDAVPIDAQLAATFQQQRVLALQRFGSSVQPTLDTFSLPEFRVGLMLLVVAGSALIYLLLSTLAAGVTGLVLRRRPSA